MIKSQTTKPTATPAKSEATTKSQQVTDILSREGGATLKEMATLAGWLPHSTRSFMTGLKKKGYVIESDKIDGVRRYRIAPNGSA